MARRKRGYTSLIIIVLVAALMLGFTFWKGNKPFLGLDLQGGISVVLKPQGDVDSDSLDQAIAIIRQRVDALGVAEPEITRQGDTILIQIPGVKDKDRALELVGQTAQLQFRPVLGEIPTGGLDLQQQLPTDSSIPVDTAPGAVPPASEVTPSSTPGGSEVTPPSEAPASPSSSEAGLGAGFSGEAALGAQTTDTVTDQPTAQPSDPTAQLPTDSTTPDPSAQTVTPQASAQAAGQLPPDICSTGQPAELAKDPSATVTLPDCKDGELVASYVVGPVLLTGDSLETARSTLGPDGEWVVNPVFKGGTDGIDKFNQAAGQCFNKDPNVCPTGRLAIVLDGDVVSAPNINEAQFQRDQIQISGNFTESTAGELATVLKYGALPVVLEPQQAQIVSATIGKDALAAGLWAGLVGLILVAAYMIAWYRILGVLAIAKLAVEAALIWSVISYLGENSGLALTLAGVTGLIVSIGVSVDSNVVYYEHLKDDVRHGRTIRSATDKAFQVSFRTIVAADTASLIAAGLLWWLTVGPVRGFAFYLGLATLLDLIASYMFMRPVVAGATRSEMCARHPKWFGLPAEPEPDNREQMLIADREKEHVGS